MAHKGIIIRVLTALVLAVHGAQSGDLGDADFQEPPPPSTGPLSTTTTNAARPSNYPLTGAITPKDPPPSIGVLTPSYEAQLKPTSRTSPGKSAPLPTPSSPSRKLPPPKSLRPPPFPQAATISSPASQKDGGSVLPTWPNPATDELEDLMYNQFGYRSRSLSGQVYPCGSSPYGNSRHAAGEYLRTAFHDMAPGSAVGVRAGIGGLDASLQYELNTPGGGENIGVGFNTTLQYLGRFFSERASAADLIALGVYSAVRACGGPPVNIRTGRVDAKFSGPIGVPQPQNDVGTFVNQFARMGFGTSEMIQLVACGHGIGGVGSQDFPTIVNPRAAPTNGTGADYFVPFSANSRRRFSEGVAVEYLEGNGTDPLVAGQCMGSKRCSDIIVFNADGNQTISQMTDPLVFRNTCGALFQRMIEVVPKATVLSDSPLRPYDAKPYDVSLSVMNGGQLLLLRGEVRIRTSVVPSKVLIKYRRRNGSSCKDCSIVTKLAGNSTGYDDQFFFYSFGELLFAKHSIKDFNVTVISSDKSETVYDNNGQGFPVDDMLLMQPSQSCLLDSAATSRLTIQAAVRNTIVKTSVNLTLTLHNARPRIAIPALAKTSVAMTPINFVGSYIIYEGNYTINATQKDQGRFEVSVNGNYTSSFNAITALGTECSRFGLQ